MEHYRRIFLFVLSVVKNEAVAEDITQETFVKALVGLSDENKNVVAWLYKVANNLCMDWFRAENKTDEMPEDLVSDFSVSDKYIKDEENRELYKAINTLGELDRRIITLFYFSGLSQREIASVTGLSFVNVRVRMDRARDKLKAILTGA